jgi:RimJ/RimL family protein N-acetyltransferase
MLDPFHRPLLRRLSTRRLLLEPQVAAHAARMFTLLQDPAIYRYENEAPPSLEWLEERFRRLETRRSADGNEQWLNWVVRLRGSSLIGFVQATLRQDRSAAIAYVFGSAHWGRGYASEAVSAMLDELLAYYGVTSFAAVLKRDNLRSVRLLDRLGFAPAVPVGANANNVLPDEMLMQRPVTPMSPASPSPDAEFGAAASGARHGASDAGRQ